MTEASNGDRSIVGFCGLTQHRVSRLPFLFCSQTRKEKSAKNKLTEPAVLVRVTGFEPAGSAMLAHWLPSGSDSKKSAFADLQEAAGSLVQTKEKDLFPFRNTGLGPSDWIRTSGLLNPIQARYQTSPHPDIGELINSALLI